MMSSKPTSRYLLIHKSAIFALVRNRRRLGKNYDNGASQNPSDQPTCGSARWRLLICFRRCAIERVKLVR